MPDFIKVTASELKSEFYRVLTATGFDERKASICADVFTTNSVDGVYSHGVNRFPKFIGMVKKGAIDLNGEAIFKSRSGKVERWDGQKGAGVVNALMCTDRAIDIAKGSGIGCV